MADPLTDFILINHKIFIVCCLILFIYFAGSIILFILTSCGLIYNRQFDKLKDDVFKKVHNIGFNMSNKYNYYLKKLNLKNNYKNIEKNETSVDYLKNFLNRRKLNDLYELQGHFKDHFQDKPRGLFLNDLMVHLCVQN